MWRLSKLSETTGLVVIKEFDAVHAIMHSPAGYLIGIISRIHREVHSARGTSCAVM